MTQLRLFSLAAVLVLCTGTANAASISAENQLDGPGTTSWDIVYNPEGSAAIGAMEAKIWANGAGVTSISGTDLIDNVPLALPLFPGFNDCPGVVAPAGCLLYGGLNIGADSATPDPVVIGTFMVSYSSNVPPITLEIVPESVLFTNIAGPIPDNSAEVLGTVGVPEPALLVLLGLGLAMLAAVTRPPVAHPRQR